MVLVKARINSINIFYTYIIMKAYEVLKYVPSEKLPSDMERINAEINLI